MITTFQTSGASAGIVKCSCALRIPTTRPLSPSSTTIGNSTWLSPTVRSSSAGVDSSPVNSGISTGASRMNASVSVPSATSSSPASAAASWSASRRRLFSSSSEKTGTNADDERRVGDERADQVRDLEGERERRHRAGRAEVAAGDDLAREARDAREAGEDREDDGVAGAPERAGLRPARGGVRRRRGGERRPRVGARTPLELVVARRRRPRRGRRRGASPRRAARRRSRSARGRPLLGVRGGGGLRRDRRMRRAIVRARRGPRPRPLCVMANIHSQEKRILRAERERNENRRYTSAIKTYFRRLEAAVAAARPSRPTPSTAASCS